MIFDFVILTIGKDLFLTTDVSHTLGWLRPLDFQSSMTRL